MRIKCILFFILSMASFQCQASFIVGYAAGTAAASRSLNDTGGETFVSRKFDYIVACDLKYEKIKEDTYEYFCPNRPERDEILFMSTVFYSDHWPSKIIYYMQYKR